jgi:hypothetical protein
MKRPVAAAIACASALAATGAAIATPETFWTADGQDLANSLERAGDGIAAPDPCKRVGARWTCAIEDDPGSGWSANYRVTLEPDGCWRGVRVWNSFPPGLGPPDARELQARARRGPEPLAACLNVIDHVRP